MTKVSKTWIVLLISFFIALGIIFFFSFDFPLSQTAVTGPVKAAGPITKTTPFEYCLHRDIDHATTLKIFFATYGRANTSSYEFEFFSNISGKKIQYNSENFKASEVGDNQFHSFSMPLQSYVQPLCFSVTSPDAINENAITITLDKNSEPVFEIWKRGSLSDLIEKTWLQKQWNTGKALGYGVCITYFTAMLFFCLYTLLSVHEKKQQ